MPPGSPTMIVLELWRLNLTPKIKGPEEPGTSPESRVFVVFIDSAGLGSGVFQEEDIPPPDPYGIPRVPLLTMIGGIRRAIFN